MVSQVTESFFYIKFNTLFFTQNYSLLRNVKFFDNIKVLLLINIFLTILGFNFNSTVSL